MALSGSDFLLAHRFLAAFAAIFDRSSADRWDAIAVSPASPRCDRIGVRILYLSCGDVHNHLCLLVGVGRPLGLA